jgi:hypothetical protein
VFYAVPGIKEKDLKVVITDNLCITSGSLDPLFLIQVVNLDKNGYNFYVDPLGESNSGPFQHDTGFFPFQGTRFLSDNLINKEKMACPS